MERADIMQRLAVRAVAMIEESEGSYFIGPATSLEKWLT